MTVTAPRCSACLSILNEISDELPVCVKFLWQPAEEGGGGAEKLVAAGVLDGRIGRILGHLRPARLARLEVGTVATKPGPLLAATDNFLATFIGKGTHGAYPYLGADPIVAAAEAVTSVQKFVSRETDPTDPCVVTVGKMSAGTAVNVIPDTASLEATVRTLNHAQHMQCAKVPQRRLRGIALANNCELDWTWLEGYPATINDPAMADYVAAVARAALGHSNFIPVAQPSMGGEDFAYYLQKVPGCFFLIGVDRTIAARLPVASLRPLRLHRRRPRRGNAHVHRAGYPLQTWSCTVKFGIAVIAILFACASSVPAQSRQPTTKPVLPPPPAGVRIHQDVAYLRPLCRKNSTSISPPPARRPLARPRLSSFTAGAGPAATRSRPASSTSAPTSP